MVEAKEDVNKMKAELAVKNQELAVATKEAEVLLKSISESTAIAEKGKHVFRHIIDDFCTRAGVQGDRCTWCYAEIMAMEGAAVAVELPYAARSV